MRYAPPTGAEAGYRRGGELDEKLAGARKVVRLRAVPGRFCDDKLNVLWTLLSALPPGYGGVILLLQTLVWPSPGLCTPVSDPLDTKGRSFALSCHAAETKPNPPPPPSRARLVARRNPQG